MFRLFIIFLVFLPQLLLAQTPGSWAREFPIGDFAELRVEVDEIEFDGNTRDSIPPIDDPRYVLAATHRGLDDIAPVLSVEINGDARAFPLEIMLWHEIVNDTIGGVPVLITYCPLCNSGVVYLRGVEGRNLDFGNTGRIRHLDMVMYDRQTESWWQQFSGRAISGALADAFLTPMPSVVEGFGTFRDRHPNGKVLVPQDRFARPYGETPFARMDSRPASPRFSKWPVPAPLRPLDYVVVSRGQAWPLDRLRLAGEVSEAGLTLTWAPGRASIHDRRDISRARDLGVVIVVDQAGNPIVHDVVFAFSFAAFVPGGDWMLGSE